MGAIVKFLLPDPPAPKGDGWKKKEDKVVESFVLRTWEYVLEDDNLLTVACMAMRDYLGKKRYSVVACVSLTGKETIEAGEEHIRVFTKAFDKDRADIKKNVNNTFGFNDGDD